MYVYYVYVYYVYIYIYICIRILCVYITIYWYMSVLTTPRKKFRTSPVSVWDASQKCNCLQNTLAKGYDQIRPAWITWVRQFHWGATVLRRSLYTSSTWRSLFLSSLASQSKENTSKDKQEYFRLLQQPKKIAEDVRSWSHSSAIRNWKGRLLDCLLQVVLGPVDLRMPLNDCWLGVCFKLPAILFTSVHHVHPSSSLLLETFPPISFALDLPSISSTTELWANGRKAKAEK